MKSSKADLDLHIGLITEQELTGVETDARDVEYRAASELADLRWKPGRRKFWPRLRGFNILRFPKLMEADPAQSANRL